MPATPKRSAARILNALVRDLKLKAGDAVPDRQMRARFEAAGGYVAEIEDGLVYAETMGWIEHDGGPAKGRFKLTAAGVSAAD